MSILSHAPVRVCDRRPSTAGRGVSGPETAVVQPAEPRLDLSDEMLAKVVAQFHAAAYGCDNCGHLPGCDCDCCPYPLPAGTPCGDAEHSRGGAA